MVFALGLQWPHPGGWTWLWGPVVLVLWVSAIALVVWLVVTNTRPRQSSNLHRAEEILAERYARGEISHEEYRERLEQIRYGGRG